MSAPPPPRLALLLMHRFYRGPFSDSLEGDLHEQWSAGRGRLWLWRQVGGALLAQGASGVLRQRLAALVALSLYFLLTLAAIAPATAPVVAWAIGTIGPDHDELQLLAVTSWLAGIPLMLGAFAGTVNNWKPVGMVVVATLLAYLTPATLPFQSALCVLCKRPSPALLPGSALLITPIASALVAGLGAWTAGSFFRSRLRHGQLP